MRLCAECFYIESEIMMQRVCFTLQVKPDRLAEYRESHKAVWPEMLAALSRHGWTNYSIFLRADGLLIGIAPQGGELPAAWCSLVRDALERVASLVADPIPASVAARHRLAPLGEALRAIQFPEDDEQLAAAREGRFFISFVCFLFFALFFCLLIFISRLVRSRRHRAAADAAARRDLRP